MTVATLADEPPPVVSLKQDSLIGHSFQVCDWHLKQQPEYEANAAYRGCRTLVEQGCWAHIYFLVARFTNALRRALA